MPQPRNAAVLTAALRSWATTTRDPDGHDVARVEFRQAPDWAPVGKTPLTGQQVDRLLTILRADLIPPRRNTPTQAAAAVDQIIAEWRAEGRTRIRPTDLIGQLPRIGQTRAWLAQHLTHLVDSGYLHETRRPGTYRL
ncbi:hypothetical protein [Actinacidiphila acididurans]|uniref:Uncharacterized protein n=1 Tax=Actinacidiphila acididurans TaxID=2784346 RepID=A0ABS2U2Z9_9ACTN|nr:hypothetical protein [Actinacidiphila acididurans]MBM9509961.1 hypothetical protein [Actinacidiphila acididurans]